MRNMILNILKTHGFRAATADPEKIAILIEPATHLIAECLRLKEVLTKLGIPLGEAGEEGKVWISGAFDPCAPDYSSLIALWHVDDRMLVKEGADGATA